MKETFALPSSDPKLEPNFAVEEISQGSECRGFLLVEPNACFASCKINLVQVLSLATEALSCPELYGTLAL